MKKSIALIIALVALITGQVQAQQPRVYHEPIYINPNVQSLGNDHIQSELIVLLVKKNLVANGWTISAESGPNTDELKITCAYNVTQVSGGSGSGYSGYYGGSNYQRQIQIYLCSLAIDSVVIQNPAKTEGFYGNGSASQKVEYSPYSSSSYSSPWSHSWRWSSQGDPRAVQVPGFVQKAVNGHGGSLCADYSRNQHKIRQDKDNENWQGTTQSAELSRHERGGSPDKFASGIRLEVRIKEEHLEYLGKAREIVLFSMDDKKIGTAKGPFQAHQSPRGWVIDVPVPLPPSLPGGVKYSLRL